MLLFGKAVSVRERSVSLWVLIDGCLGGNISGSGWGCQDSKPQHRTLKP